MFCSSYSSFYSCLLDLTDFGALLMLGLIIACLRSTANLMEAARRKEQQAEQQLAVAYEQQQQPIRQKELFFRHVNHELRSPLTTVYGSLQIIKEANDAQKPLSDFYQTECINQALQSCEHLVLLTNQVLEATYLGSDIIPCHPEELSVAQGVQDLLEYGDPRIRQVCQVSLNISENIKVWADRQLLSRVLWNLLSNVSKYCPPQTQVVISAAPYERVSGSRAPTTVYICVKDAGPGIPPSEISHIFEPFARLRRDVSMSVSGSGLGLYICKQMVETMGGRIWAESSGVMGEGSRFYFTLPILAPV